MDQMVKPPDDGEERQPVSDTKLLLIIIAILMIAIGGWFVVKRLQETEKVQDCIMRGGRNCTSIPDPANQ